MARSRLPRQRLVGSVVVALTSAAALAACGSGHPDPRAGPTWDLQKTCDLATQEVQAYLDLWVKAGPYAAAATYFVPEEVPPGAPVQGSAGADAPVLLNGTIKTCKQTTWKSADDFTALVTMDLHFRGDAARWNMTDGLNDRFFTFTRANAGDAYRMRQATGP